MNIIKQSHLILGKVDGLEMIRNIEFAGRTCYKSEDRITDTSAEKFVSMLIKNRHENVLEHEHISVKCITDRGVSHELVRHRIASYSQESTRFCNYKNKGLTYILPLRFYNESGIRFNIWLGAMSYATEAYNTLIDMGEKPEEARGVLPIDLKTEIVISTNLRAWRHILKERTSSKAHPHMRSLMLDILYDFKCLVPVVFNDINGGGDATS